MLGFSCSWQTLLFLLKFQRIKRNIFGYRGGSLSVTHTFLNPSQPSMFSEIELCCLLGLTSIICRILFQVINLYKLFLILIAVLFIYHQILFVLILIIYKTGLVSRILEIGVLNRTVAWQFERITHSFWIYSYQWKENSSFFDY